MNARLFSAARLVPVVAAAWLTAGCDITVGLDAARFLDRQKKDFQVTGTPDLVLSTFDGTIEVRAWDRPEVSVEIEKRAANKRQADEIEVKTSQSGNRITVDVRSPEETRAHIGFSQSRSARLIVSVPRETNLDARTGDGSISVERLSGKLQLNTGDGTVHVTETSGELRAHTGDGTMTLERVDGRVDADTGDGSITLNGKLEGVRLKTGDGSLRLRADSGSRMTDDWDIRTGDGSVTLELPEAFDADLDAHAGDGGVSMRTIAVKGDVSRNTVRGQIGTGGRSLRVRTGDGGITISRS